MQNKVMLWKSTFTDKDPPGISPSWIEDVDMKPIPLRL